MSGSLSQPWIQAYLLDIATTYGGDLSSIPTSSHGKKVQLVKFITHEIPGEDAWIWALVSDQAHKLPVRFSKEAMRQHRQDPLFGSRPISDYKTAVMQIKQFRPMFTRIPRGVGQQGMHSYPQLALEVCFFQLKGSMGEPPWGKPKDVETHEDIRAWSEGLKAGGGGGNVLKLRKLEREQEENAAEQGVEDDPPERMVVHKQVEIKGGSSSRMHQNGLRENRVKSKAGRNRKVFKTKPVVVTDEMYRVISTLQPHIVSGSRQRSHPNTTPIPEPTPEPRKLTLRKKRDALSLSTPESSPIRSPQIAQAEDQSLPSTPSRLVVRPTTPSHWTPSVYGGTQQAQSPPFPISLADDSPGHHPESIHEYDIGELDQEYPSVIDGLAHEETPGADQELPADANDDADMAEPEAPVEESIERAEVAEVQYPEGRVEQRTVEDSQNSYGTHISKSSDLPAPTPAQRTKLLPFSPPLQPLCSPSIPQPSSSAMPTFPLMSSAPAQSPLYVPDSSPGRTPSIGLSGVVIQRGRNVSGDVSAYGRILVPDSDISMSQSQSQSQPQPSQVPVVVPQVESQSQSQSEGYARTAQSLSYTSGSQGAGKSQNSQPQTANQPQGSGHAPDQAADQVVPSGGAVGPDDNRVDVEVVKDDAPTGTTSHSTAHHSPVVAHENPVQVNALSTRSPVLGSRERTIDLTAESEEESEFDHDLDLGNVDVSPEHWSPGSGPEVDELDSDDAKTDAMVCKHDIFTTGRPQKAHINHVAVPVTYHDAESWRAPSFMAGRSSSIAASIAGSSHKQKSRERTVVNKRVLPSHSDEDDRPAKKRKKTLRSPVSIESSPEPPVAPPNRRPSSAVRLKSPRSIPAKQSASSSITLEKTDSLGSTTSKVKRIDLHHTKSASPALSRSLPVKTYARYSSGSTASSSKNVGPTRGDPEVLKDAGKGTRHINVRTSGSASSLVEGEGTSRRHSAKGKERMQSLSVTNSEVAMEPSLAEMSRSRDDSLRTSSRPKLGGYKLDLRLKRGESSDLPLVTWEALTEVLLKTGRARHKEQLRRKELDSELNR